MLRRSHREEQQVGSHNRAGESPPVGADDDHLVQVPDLCTVVQRVAESVRPVKERQDAEDEQVETCYRRLEQSEEALIAGRLDPAQRKSQSEEEHVHG